MAVNPEAVEQKAWKPSVSFATFPIDPDRGFRVAARMIHDPNDGRVKNFLRRFFKDAQNPMFLNGSMSLKEATREASNYPRRIKDPKDRTWEVFVHQLDIFSDGLTLAKETERLTKEIATRGAQIATRYTEQSIEMARMEYAIHTLATTFSPVRPPKP